MAHIARQVPELQLNLPVTAMGKDHLGNRSVSPTPSNTVFQFSLQGLFGFTIARIEGLEINILGLVWGADPFGLAIKLPGIGRIGWARE